MMCELFRYLCLFSLLNIGKTTGQIHENEAFAQMESLHQEMRLLKQIVSEQADEITQLKNKVDQHQNNFIGFTAYNTVDMYLTNGQTAIFNSASTNAGGGYDTTTGIFTCPIAGLYFFGTASFHTGGESVSMQLVKEGAAMTGAFGDKDNYDQGANFWVTECSAGERVWSIQTQPTGGTLAVGTGGNILSSFVGFLIAMAS